MKHIKTINEINRSQVSGTKSGWTDSLEDSKYELKKDVKGARIGNFTNVLLPKGTIIYNLPGGVFADHFSLKNKYSSKSSQGPQYFDKPTFKGIMIRQMPDILAAIEKNSKVLESITEGTYNSKDHIGDTSDGQGSNAEIYKKGKGYYVVVSGEVDYDFTAKNDKELLQKLKDNEFDSTDILESVNEKLARGLKPLLKLGSTITKKIGEEELLKLSDKFEDLDDERGDEIAGDLNMAIELMQDGYPKDATGWLKKFNKECKKALTEGTYIDLRIVNENVNDEIELALTNWLNILAEGDPIKITDLYLDNGVLLGTVAKEIKQGHTEIQAYFDMFLKKSPIGSVDTFILQNFGDICISDGTYTFELDGEDGQRASVSARYTYVWKKVDGKWMIATHHSSVNP